MMGKYLEAIWVPYPLLYFCLNPLEGVVKVNKFKQQLENFWQKAVPATSILDWNRVCGETKYELVILILEDAISRRGKVKAE